MGSDGQRRELGALLRARREQLARVDLGLPAVGRSRTTGLRREEVCYLSGVSVTWYTWLEQGRDITPSRQVLDAIARTLRLSPSEHAYVMSLAGYVRPAPSPEGTARVTPQAAPEHLQRLLDSLPGSPAFVLGSDWGIVAWNAAYAVLYPGVATAAAADRNLLWLVFTDPYVRELLPHWQTDSQRLLAEFRAEAGRHLGEPALAALVQRLQAASAPFRAGWTSHAIEGFSSRERLFRHPCMGDLRLEQHQLTPADHPDLHLVVYTPVDDGRTPARLAALLTRASTAEPLRNS